MFKDKNTIFYNYTLYVFVMNIDNEFFKGTIVGITQTIFGHPLDTIKTKQQNKMRISNETIRSLYKGFQYQLFTYTFYNSLLFGIYSNCKKNGFTTFQSGFISGGIISVAINPFELYKIQEQVSRKRKKNVFETLNYFKMNPMRGIHYTFLRESFSTGLYFSTYYTMLNKDFNAFISGGIAGVSSWFFTYPFDTCKTKYQINPTLSFSTILKQGGLYNGISSCLIRAFIVNGISFYVYELL